MGGGGLNGWATKEKRTFFLKEKSFYGQPLSREGGVKALVAGPLRKELFFCGFPKLSAKLS